MTALLQVWTAHWSRPLGAWNLIALRAIAAGNALWLLWPRVDLLEVMSWPSAFWREAERGFQVRFLLRIVPIEVERLLLDALFVALGLCAIGVLARVFALVAALLLYHFAPVQNALFFGTGPSFWGLTLPMLALFFVGFSLEPKTDAGPSPEWAWPVRLARTLVAFQYFFAGYSKLIGAGPVWATGAHIRESVLLFATWGNLTPPLAATVAANPALCWAIGIGTLAAELSFPLALVSPVAARLLVPLMFAGHLGIAAVYGIYYFNLPMLLVFVDWGRVVARIQR